VANKLIWGAVGLLAAALAAGETPVRARQATATRMVLASVTDAQNRVFADLGPDDFVLSENGEPRDVLAAYAADYPIVVLVDNSADARRDLDAIRAAVNRFLSRTVQRFVGLGTLADPPAMLTALEDERPAVLARLDGLAASQSSLLMPIEAIAAAARTVRAGGSPFSAIVVVSAHSIDAAQPESTPLLPEILDTGAVVHVVSRAAPRGGAAPRRQADLLRDLAEQTRGNYTAVFSTPSYGIALDNLADRLGTEMIVEYIVPPGPRPAGDVQIGVRIPGALVRGLKVSK
jgi:hypothetical protein